MAREIVRIVLPSHPLLGRNVNHDSASRAYRVSPPRRVDWRNVRHQAFMGMLDQLNIGRCTGCAGVAAIYHSPYVSGVVKPWFFGPDLNGATALYSAATAIDPFAGQYPPTDTGSDGLSIAKVLKSKGIISGYLWAFTLEEALAQLLETPLMTGLPWLNSMFNTTTTGGRRGHVVVNKASGFAGGHEICVDELIVGSQPDRSDWWVGGPNSWGPSWGDGGRWYLKVPEWGWLLSQRGDVVALVPRSEPAPEPAPTPDSGADQAGDDLWAAVGSWANRPHASLSKIRRELRTWADRTGRS